jgi:hypothetical protein
MRSEAVHRRAGRGAPLECGASSFYISGQGSGGLGAALLCLLICARADGGLGRRFPLAAPVYLGPEQRPGS